MIVVLFASGSERRSLYRGRRLLRQHLRLQHLYGALLWKGQVSLDTQIISSPTVANGVLYIGDESTCPP